MSAKTRGNAWRVLATRSDQVGEEFRRALDAFRDHPGEPVAPELGGVLEALARLDPWALQGRARGELVSILLAGLRRRLEVHPGWRRSELPACLNVLVGGSCPRTAGVVGPCGCSRWAAFLDHRAMWTTPEGLILIGEPYGVDASGREFAAFVQYCRDLALEVTIEGGSSHYPFSTVLLVIRPAGQVGVVWGSEGPEDL